MQVVCPAELAADRTIRIQLPDGREFDVQVPEGVEAGAAFLVGPFPPAWPINYNNLDLGLL